MRFRDLGQELMFIGFGSGLLYRQEKTAGPPAFNKEFLYNQK
jgi:hypothetical protein